MKRIEVCIGGQWMLYTEKDEEHLHYWVEFCSRHFGRLNVRVV